MVERLWRTVKYEDIYLRDYADGVELRSGLARYFRSTTPHDRTKRSGSKRPPRCTSDETRGSHGKGRVQSVAYWASLSVDLKWPDPVQRPFDDNLHL